MNATTSFSQLEHLIEVESKPGAPPRVVVHGDVDFRRSPQIRDAVVRLLDEGNQRIDLELSRVVFVDSSGISALVDSAKLAAERNARLVLVSPSRQLLHVLEISGFKPLFEFEQVPEMPGPPPARLAPPVLWHVSAFRVPCDPELVADVRLRVAQVAESMPFTAEEVEDIKLAVGEASTNAFRYGCPHGRLDSILVRCVGEPSGLTVEIYDSGPGFQPETIPEPELGSLKLGGRGIFFMRLTMDEVRFVREAVGTTVRMVKYLKRPTEERPESASVR